MTAIFGFPALMDWIEKKRSKGSGIGSLREKRINKLRIGCIPFPPFINYQLVDGVTKISGLFYDLFEELKKEKNIDIEYIPIQNEDSISLLKTNEIDIVCCLFKTIQRARVMDFSSCFYSVSVGGVGSEKIRNVLLSITPSTPFILPIISLLSTPIIFHFFSNA